MKKLKVVTEKLDQIEVKDIDLSKHLVIHSGGQILTYNPLHKKYAFIDPTDQEWGMPHETIKDAFGVHGDDLTVYKL